MAPPTAAGSAMTLASINPATGETVAHFEELSEAELQGMIARAEGCWQDYRHTRVEQRSEWLRYAADILESETKPAAAMITTEMGKTIAASVAEVEKCVRTMRFYAEQAPGMLADEPINPATVGAESALVRYRPMGVILAVMPWNYPLWQVVRFAAPALMAGNVCMLKHASNVPQSALYLEDLFARTGLPLGTFQTLLIGTHRVEQVLRDRRVAAATLTGSETAGRSVGSICADEIKKTVLELGGSDPFIVMPTADVVRAADVGVTARVQNNGQACIAAKRFVIHNDIYDAFLTAFVDNMARLKVGDPMDASTNVGPLASVQARAEVEALVDDALSKGATLECGGKRVDGPGAYYPPTVVSGVSNDMRLYHEEVFGPVAAVYRVSDIDEAISLANDTQFGLGASAWTTDPAEADRFTSELAAGAVFINGMTASYPELPFGGIRRSGYGRELAKEGVREFCNVTTVWAGA